MKDDKGLPENLSVSSSISFGPGSEDAEVDLVTPPQTPLLGGRTNGHSPKIGDDLEEDLSEDFELDNNSFESALGDSDENESIRDHGHPPLEDPVLSREEESLETESLEEMMARLTVQASSTKDIAGPSRELEDRENDSLSELFAKKVAANEDVADHEYTDELQKYRDEAQKWGSFRVAFLASLISRNLNGNGQEQLSLLKGDRFLRLENVLYIGEDNLSDTLQKTESYQVSRNGEKAFDVSIQDNKRNCRHFVDGQDQFDIDIQVPADVITDESSQTHQALFEHINEMVETMFRCGLDRFVINGNPVMVAAFEEAAKTLENREGVKLEIIVEDAHALKNEDAKANDDIIGDNKFDDENGPWIQQVGGFNALSDNNKEKAREAYEVWVNENPHKHTFGLEEYVSYVQERHQIEADEADSSFNFTPSR